MAVVAVIIVVEEVLHIRRFVASAGFLQILPMSHWDTASLGLESQLRYSSLLESVTSVFTYVFKNPDRVVLPVGVKSFLVSTRPWKIAPE